MKQDRSAGFTLLEILVALVVLGFLLLGLGQGTRFGLLAVDRQSRLTDQLADLDAFDRVFRGLIQRMVPGAPTAPPNIIGDTGRLAFTSELPQAAANLPLRLADMVLAVDPRHRLVLRWIPHLDAARFGAAPPPTDTVILEGIDRLELAYWPRGGTGWNSAWNSRVPPALVRVRLAFAPGDRRHWPDIVESPMLDAP